MFLKKRDFGVLFNGGRGRGGAVEHQVYWHVFSPVRDDVFVYLCTNMGMCPQHRKKPATGGVCFGFFPPRRSSHVVEEEKKKTTAATRGHSAYDSIPVWHDSRRRFHAHHPPPPPPPSYSTQIAAATQTVLGKEKGEVKGQ